jgi:hypothetical protein
MPVPRDIPALMETTLRIKHYGELGDEGRQARVDKLREADPEGSFLAWYKNLPPLSPGPHPQWTPRVSDGAVLTAVSEPGATDIDVEAEAAALDLEGPVLTVALLAARGEEPEGISKLAALPTEQLAVPVQRLLVTEMPSVGDSTDGTEGVDVVAVPAGSRPAAMANAALAAARGDYLVFLTIPTAISAADLAAIVTAHDQGHALVAGTLVDPTATPAGHAGALLDQPVMGDQQWRFCAAGYVSYAREPLRGVGGFDELTAAPEAAVVRRLVQRGATAVVVPELRIAPRPLASAGALIRHRFNVGRAMISDDGERWPPTASTDLWRIGAGAMRQAAVRSRSVSSVRRAGPVSGVAVTSLVWAGAVATLVGAATEAVVRRRRGARTPS